MMKLAILGVATLAGLVNALPTVNTTFCERWAVNLYGEDTAANEYTLMNAIVTTRGGLALAANSGIKKYFDGNKPVGSFNFTDPANAGAKGALKARLLAYVLAMFGCKKAAWEHPYVPTFNTMAAAHSAMEVVNVDENQFSGDFTSAMTTAGITSLTAGTDDTAYINAIWLQFSRGAMTNEVCSQADCPAYAAFFEYTSNSNPLSWGSGQNGTGPSDLTIPVGSNVAWYMNAFHSVIQTETATSTTLVTDGFTSGAVGAKKVWVKNFDTAGVYYFTCGNPAHSATMRGMITVQAQLSGASSLQISSFIAIIALVLALAL